MCAQDLFSGAISSSETRWAMRISCEGCFLERKLNFSGCAWQGLHQRAQTGFWVWIPDLSLTSCVILNKSHSLSKPPLPLQWSAGYYGSLWRQKWASAWKAFGKWLVLTGTQWGLPVISRHGACSLKRDVILTEGPDSFCVVEIVAEVSTLHMWVLRVFPVTCTLLPAWQASLGALYSFIQTSAAKVNSHPPACLLQQFWGRPRLHLSLVSHFVCMGDFTYHVHSRLLN